jgi:hypothetical protein
VDVGKFNIVLMAVLVGLRTSNFLSGITLYPVTSYL